VRCRRLTPAEQEYIRLHAFTMVPSTRVETNPWALEPWKDTSLLTMLQAATYIAPAAFEQGTAVTVREQVPPFAFVPNMPGKVVLGHQYSYERSTEKPHRRAGTDEPRADVQLGLLRRHTDGKIRGPPSGWCSNW
jgi:hypothetical protein